MSGAVEGVALQDAVTTLDVWLAAYATKPDTAIALPDHDDDLLTFGHLRTILASLTTPPARSYAEGVEDAAKVVKAINGKLTKHRTIAAIRLLSQGEKA